MTHKTRPERRRLARIRQANWIKTYKKAAGDDAIDDAADRVLEIDATIAQMQDAENLLRRLFIYFAILRSSARWSTERERMLNMLYTIDDVGRPLRDPPINAGEMVDALTDFESLATIPAPAPASIF